MRLHAVALLLIACTSSRKVPAPTDSVVIDSDPPPAEDTAPEIDTAPWQDTAIVEPTSDCVTVSLRGVRAPRQFSEVQQNSETQCISSRRCSSTSAAAVVYSPPSLGGGYEFFHDADGALIARAYHSDVIGDFCEEVGGANWLGQFVEDCPWDAPTLRSVGCSQPSGTLAVSEADPWVSYLFPVETRSEVVTRRQGECYGTHTCPLSTGEVLHIIMVHNGSDSLVVYDAEGTPIGANPLYDLAVGGLTAPEREELAACTRQPFTPTPACGVVELP